MAVDNKRLIVRESFLLPFRGSEIWALEMDGLFEHTALAQVFCCVVPAAPTLPKVMVSTLLSCFSCQNLLAFKSLYSK